MRYTEAGVSNHAVSVRVASTFKVGKTIGVMAFVSAYKLWQMHDVRQSKVILIGIV